MQPYFLIKTKRSQRIDDTRKKTLNSEGTGQTVWTKCEMVSNLNCQFIQWDDVSQFTYFINKRLNQ